jgi:hypothetical protein
MNENDFSDGSERMTFDEIDHLPADFLRNMLRFVDEQMRILDGQISEDMRIKEDSALIPYSEYFAGQGFVAGQRYITSVCGGLRVPKQQALLLGPQFGAGLPYASLVNAAANYAKHSEEWNFDDLKDLQAATKATIEKAGVTVGWGEAVAWNLFDRLGLGSFGDLLPILSSWSDAVSDSVG